MVRLDNAYAFGWAICYVSTKLLSLYCTYLCLINVTEVHIQNARLPPLHALQILNMPIARNEKDSSQGQLMYMWAWLETIFLMMSMTIGRLFEFVPIKPLH